MALYMRTNGVTKKVGTSSPSAIPASNSTYDNTQSGLQADNVQNAIDELNSNLDGLKPAVANSEQIADNASGVASYPAGYNKSNCIVISYYYVSNAGNNTMGGAIISLADNNINITNNSGAPRTFKVFLLKIN